MSFIFDDKRLVDALIKAADKSALKTAQQQLQIPEEEIQKAYQNYIVKTPNPANYENYKNWYIQKTHAANYKKTLSQPTITPQVIDAYKLAKKLILGIRSQFITDPNDPEFVKKTAPLDFDSKTAPQIKPENLITLGDFLTWAATNQIKWDGQRIAWDYSPGDPDATPPIPASGTPPDIENPWVFQSYQKGRDRDQYTRQAITKTYYANKDGLLKFLTYLRDTPTAKENKVFEVMIGKVINQANQYLQPDEKIGPRPEDKPASQFNDNDIVDGFPTNIMDIKKPYDGIEQNAPMFTNASNKLTYGDIKDFGSLQNWISGMRDAATPDVDPNSAEGNPCQIVHILFLRARYLSSQVRYDRLRPKYSELTKLYLTNITNFGKQFKYKDQACAVTAPGTGPGEKPGQKPGQPGQGGGLAAASPQILMQLSSLRPFNSQFVSFQEITKFFDLYEQYANDATVSQMVNKLKFSMQQFRDETQMGSDTIQLYNLTTNQFQGMLKNPSKAYMVAALLYDVVFYGGQLYQRLVTSLQTIANDPERGKYIDYRAMQQQVTPGGPQLTNVSQLNRLMYSLKQEWNQK